MSRYDEIIVLIDAEYQTFQETAKKRIPQLCQALREENKEMPKEEVREIVQRDCLRFWSKKTIITFIPDEFKDAAKVEAGKISAEKKKQKKAIEISNEGVPIVGTENPSNSQNKQESNVSEETKNREEKNNSTSNEVLLQTSNELRETLQLLSEERSKNTELTTRLEQTTKKIDELDGQVAEHAYKMQELSRKLTEQSTRVIDKDGDASSEIEKPKSETHWSQSFDAQCTFCQKVTPWIIRHFISGKVVKWIDRERYKEMYGMVPAE